MAIVDPELSRSSADPQDQCINKKLNNDNDYNREVHLSRPDEDDEVYRPQYSVDDEMKDDIYNEIEEVCKRRILIFISP